MIVPCQGFAVSKRQSNGLVALGANVEGITVAVEIDDGEGHELKRLFLWDPKDSALKWIDADPAFAIGMAQIGGQQIAVPGR